MFKEPIFVNPKAVIGPDTQVIFVADLFVDDYVGGAELTSEALIAESPFTIQKIRSREVNLATLQQGVDKFWVFGNFSQLNPELIPSIVANLKYAVLEYDYKYCRFRSPEKHLTETGSPCDCHDQLTGKLVSAFYHGATSLWWMSEAQKARYTTLFPFLLEKDNVVLSSVFSKNTLGTLKVLRDKVPTTDRKGWIVLGSQSWVKGFDAAKKWCEETGKDHEVVWNLPYDQVLAKMASAEGFVYLPLGEDACPRMVIEAKLLGCKLHLNEHVQHAGEEWFSTDNLEDIHDYLYTAPHLFWKGIKTVMDYRPKISGYTTTYNCVSQGYPFEASIRSMLQFCDEVCVVDGGSTDGTIEKLIRLAAEVEPTPRISEYTDESVNTLVDFLRTGKEFRGTSGSIGPHNSKLRIKVVARDWNHPRFAVFDGLQKAEARRMCTGDFCWQMDSDEIVLKKDAHKVIDLCSKFPQGVNIISLPVLDLWGSRGKVRLDTTPWKWRLSRNDPRITHGIPVELRRLDVNGDMYSAPGSDGCDMIDSETGKRLDHVTFVSSESENARILALRGDKNALTAYQNWMMNVIGSLPSVVHYSWFDLERKIKTYKGYWSRHWESLYNVPQEDTAKNNMFFDKPWADVEEKEIKDLAQRLEEIGGWIWHSKWDGTVTPHMTLDISDND